MTGTRCHCTAFEAAHSFGPDCDYFADREYPGEEREILELLQEPAGTPRATRKGKAPQPINKGQQSLL